MSPNEVSDHQQNSDLEAQEARFRRGEGRRKKLPPEWLFLIIVGVIGLSLVSYAIYRKATEEIYNDFPQKPVRQ